MDDQKLTARFIYDERMPNDYIEHGKDHAREEFCYSLIRWMVAQPDYTNQHFVIQLVEREDKTSAEHAHQWDNSYYSITARISLAQTQHIKMYAPDYESMPLRKLSHSALEEIVRRIKGIFKKCSR